MEIERLKELLHYDPDTGIFRWRKTRSRGARAGGIAGARDADGYTIIKIMGKSYRASRLAIFYVTGEWPPEQVDHQNRVRDDDRFDNLIPCDPSGNQQNTGLRHDNKSGFQGVSWHKHAKSGRPSESCADGAFISAITPRLKLRALPIFSRRRWRHRWQTP